MSLWDWWPWQRTERERELLARIADLEAALLGKQLELANYAMVLESDRLLFMHHAAVQKSRALGAGVPQHILDTVQEEQIVQPPPIAPPPMRQTHMNNGVHRG
jgi:hypothetical protein